ncbi:MAG: transporter substrate-binding domain-containing protein, partial [Arcobacteraceae bacterium]|nr:transporter substrate-binding domain-containing protein [Arcobacteraceae bacterium]
NLILKKYNIQNKTKEELLYEANRLSELAFYKTDKIGDINKQKIKNIYHTYNVLGLIKNKINFDEFIFEDKKAKLALTYDETKYIKKNRIIKMCNYANISPLEFAFNGDQNDMRGVSIDHLKIIENQLDVKFVNVPTNSIFQSQEFLKQKKCDILPFSSKNKYRETFSNFTTPYLSLPFAIFTHKDNALQIELEDLHNKSIAQLKGTTNAEMLKKEYPNIEIVTGDSVKELLEMVNDKKVYATIGIAPTAIELLYKYALDNVRISGYTSKIVDFHIAVRDDDILLLNILNKSLANITKKDSKKIYKKWVKPLVKEKIVDYTLIWNIVIGFIFILFFILFFYTKQ